MATIATSPVRDPDKKTAVDIKVTDAMPYNFHNIRLYLKK